MTLTKLNEDSSWLWEISGIKVLVDPWFSSSQVDFHPLFSKQFHVREQPSLNDIPRADFIFISHPFTDHCNKETLLQLDPTTPVICLPNIQKKIQKWRHFQTFVSFKNAPFELEKISKTAILDLVHHAYLISDGEKVFCYAPHGCNAILPRKKADVLITTTTTFHLPFFLGGTVNLGIRKAMELSEKLAAKTLVSTHDEVKIQKGIVAKLSRRTFANHPEVQVLNPFESFEF